MIDRKHLGRRYGPYRYTVGLEEIRDFAAVLAGGAPGRVFAGEPPERPHPWHVDEEAGRASPHGSIIAPPTFVVRFAMTPFAHACSDPSLGIDLVKVLHGEQAFELGDVVRPGDVIETVGEIAELYEKAGKDFMTIRSTSTNQRGKVVAIGTWKAVVVP
ncbi:MAG TPA: MaoC family dehydratase N-terminal domain-containing protein [Anaeromyxobacteraceae bacterium]|nr:MaoC family dehydratase N-terminal domain-containing protein [Anaeromyxobacteraceae bacterium]